jgi:hypothetical protein
MLKVFLKVVCSDRVGGNRGGLFHGWGKLEEEVGGGSSVGESRRGNGRVTK